MASMNTKRASSSSSSTHQSTYEVFLSFRGEDTRDGFTSHLYTALRQKSIYTFIDDKKLERGKSISPTLVKAIKESRFAIVIFSKNYASSTWCLEELEEIIGCISKTGMTVLPIFYYVDPSDVRKQTGTFKQAFDEHEQRFKGNIEKVQKWRAILKEVANISGWHVPKRSEAKCIQDIVKVILNELSNTFSAPMGLIGIESRVEKLKSHLSIESNDVRIIGIWGTGGMGKTTLARAVYGMVSDKFDACCFIANVREESEKYGLCKLQKKLLKKLLMLKNLNFQDVGEGLLMMKKMLQNKKILLVLDDVTKLDQLEILAGEHCWFRSGSRVIITTRDKHLLELHEVNEIYEAEVLNQEEALQLFSLKALKRDHPPEDYGKLSQDFVDYCKGLPLALEVLGSFLFGKNIDEWKNGLDRLKEFPDRRILDVLQISYDDGLQSTEKEIFLYIACFFNHEHQDVVMKLLDCLGLYPKIGLKVLKDKSLVKLHENQLWMHDLLQEMGRDIVHQENPKDPGKRSRLWSFEDIDKVLTKNMGTGAIQGIVLRLHEPKKVYWNPKAFSKMQDLKLLEICGVQLMLDLKRLPNSLRILDWRGYPSKSLTSLKSFENLKLMDLSESLKLVEVPGIIEVPNLESLVLENCINLRRIHPSIGIHKKITILNLQGCKNLRSLPSKFEMERLTELDLSRCLKITKLPPSIGIHKKITILNLRQCRNLTSLPSKFEMEHLTKLDLYQCSRITKLPPSIGILKKLTILFLCECKNLTSLPSKFEMECLISLNLGRCPKITKIPEFGRNMKRVRHLSLDGTAITTLPTSIEHLTDLVGLNLSYCKNLVHLPDAIFNFKLIETVNLKGCSKLYRLPENLGNAESLRYLDLTETAIRKVPSSIGLLKNLYYLAVSPNESRYEPLPFYSMPTSPLPVNLKFSSLSLSPASSLTELTLSDCNLRAISNDIGSLLSLEQLNLSGNDFVCLPESIIRLSKLERMYLYYCTSLRSLPKLPLKMREVGAQGCISLEMVPDPLKPSNSLEPSLYLQNCFQLADNQSCIDWFISGIKKYLKLSPSLPIEVLEKSNLSGEKYGIKIPGSEIPEWFSHQSMGNEVEIKQPSHLYNEWMGSAAICIVFGAHFDFPSSSIDFSLIGNGKSVFICSIRCWDRVSSDHLWLVHLTPQLFNKESNKLMCEGDANGFSQFRIKMETRCGGKNSWLTVKKWGFRMIYNKDMDRTMVQYSNSSITPYDGMDVLHHNFDNSSVAVECQKVKHSRDDYNGAGPSGEGSSNDIPNPATIKRHTETHGNSDSEESSDYKDCDEVLSDRDESNDDLEEDNDDSDESSVDRGKYSESDLDD